MSKNRLWTILLAFALALVCILPCAMADENIAMGDETVRSMCWQGDTLYILTESLYRWQPGDAAPQPVWQAEGIDMMRYWEMPPEDEEELALWRKAIRYVFPGPDAPLALHPYTGELFTVGEDGLTLVAAIPAEGRTMEQDGETVYRSVRGAAGRDGVIWLLLETDTWEDWSKRTILRYDMANGSVSSFDMNNVVAIAAADDGALLLTAYQDNEYAYLLVDGQTGEETRRLDASVEGHAVWYDGGVLEYLGGELRALDGTGTKSVKGYAPAGSYLGYESVACSDSGLCAVETYGYIFVRDLNHPAEKTVLTIAGTLYPDRTTEFSLANPDIAVVVLNESVQQAALTGSADIFAVSTPNEYDEPGMYGTLVRRAGLAPIPSDKLSKLAGTFYDSIRSAIAPQGELLALPTAITTQSWTLNETLWEQFELGEVPTTFTELMDTLQRWQDDYADDNPDYALGELPTTLAGCIRLMMREYILQCGDAYPDFTREDFRQAALAMIAHKDTIEQAGENWGMPILFNYSLGFGKQGIDSEMTRMMLRPTVSSDSEQKMAATLYLLTISASSQNQEAATRFIEWYADHMSAELRYMLDPSQDTPLRADNYETRAADLKAQKEAIEAALAEADGEEALDLQEQLQYQEERIARWETETGWIISPDSLANYRDVAAHLVIPYNSPLLTNEGGLAALDERIERACGQSLTEASLDILLRELNNVAEMIMKENE